MSPRRCTTLPIRVLSTALLPRRSLSASISSRWRSSNSTLKNCDNWASRIFDIRPSCLEWSSNKLERSYTNFSGLQETIENTLFHDDVNSGNAPLRRLFERRITNTSFNSIQFNSLTVITGLENNNFHTLVSTTGTGILVKGRWPGRFLFGFRVTNRFW